MKLYDIAPEVLLPREAAQGEEGWVDASAISAESTLRKAGRTVVDINNVAAYWGTFFNNNPDHHALSPKDAPVPVSPWPRVWMEYAAKSAYPGVYGPGSGAPSLQMGFMIDQTEVEGQKRHVMHQLTYYPEDRYKAVLPFGSQWLFIKRHAWWTDKDGAFLGEQIDGSKAYKAMLRSQYNQSDEEIWHNLRLDSFPVWLAFAFCNCRNVSLIEHRTAPKVAAKRAKAGKPAGVTYKTLVIDGMKETLRTEGGSGRHGLKKALHICRGHFATYTPDRPLFGKITGTVWKPMHTRGSKERGEVRKDYKITAGGDS